MIKKLKRKVVKKTAHWVATTALLLGIFLVLIGLGLTRQPEKLRPSALPLSQGSLSVSPTLASGCYTLYNEWSHKKVTQACGSRVFLLPVGAYRVEYDDLTGYQKPFSRPVFISAGSHETVSGVYTSNCRTPNLRIVVQPCNAHYRITNGFNIQTSEQIGSKGFWLEEGDYRLEFFHMPGRRTPDAVTFKILPGMTTTINAHYKK